MARTTNRAGLKHTSADFNGNNGQPAANPPAGRLRMTTPFGPTVLGQVLPNVATPEQDRAGDGAPVTRSGTTGTEAGGRWRNAKDAMHFQLDFSPAELDRGIAPSESELEAESPRGSYSAGGECWW